MTYFCIRVVSCFAAEVGEVVGVVGVGVGVVVGVVNEANVYT